MSTFYFLLLFSVMNSVNCLDQNMKQLCVFRNLNGQFVSPMPDRLRHVIYCCVTGQCGGIAIHVDLGNRVDHIAPEWFTTRIVAEHTAYVIKKKQSWIFKTPVSHFYYSCKSLLI